MRIQIPVDGRRKSRLGRNEPRKRRPQYIPVEQRQRDRQERDESGDRDDGPLQDHMFAEKFVHGRSSAKQEFERDYPSTVHGAQSDEAEREHKLSLTSQWLSLVC